VGWVLEFGDAIRIWAEGGPVQGSRRLLGERLVRAIVVVLGDEGVELALLGPEAGGGRSGGGLLEGFVKALVAAVLLGMAREDEFGIDADPDPPDVKPREPVDGLGGEGGAIVAADDVREAELSEGTLKQGLDELVLGGRQADAGQAVPGEAVDEGERVTPLAVEGLELAFEIGSPDGVGVGHRGLAKARVARMGATTPGLDEAMALEEECSSRSSGEWEGRALPSQDPEQLGRTPTGVLAADSQKGRHDVLTGPVRARESGMRAILQTWPALGLPALDPLVAGLAGDAEEGAQLGEVEDGGLEGLDEAELLVHG
jgi:hypothetical protein